MSEQQKPSAAQGRQNLDWMTRNIDMNGTTRAMEEINDIRASLDQQEAASRARMPERIFAGIFLPIFAKGKNEFYPQVDLNWWANFAGNEYREVDVISPKGEVLFTVPPLFDRAGINSITGKDRQRIQGGNILNVIKNAELRSRVSPKDGTAFLNAHLKQRALFMGMLPPSVKENILRWNDIFKKYGLPPIVDTEEVTHKSDSVSNTSNTQQKVTSNDDWELL